MLADRGKGVNRKATRKRVKKKEGILIIWNKVTENDWKQKEAKKSCALERKRGFFLL